MGWLRRRRERRTVELAAAIASAMARSKPAQEDPVTLVGILSELARMDLDRKRLDNELEMKRIQSTHADREAAREARSKAASDARDAIKRRKLQNLLPVIGNWVPDAVCEDCRAGLEGRQPAHNRDMIRHASHLGQFRAYMAARNRAPGGERNAATSAK